MSALPLKAAMLSVQHRRPLVPEADVEEENPARFTSNRAFFHDRFIGFAERGALLDGDDGKLLRHATCDSSSEWLSARSMR